MANNKKAEQSLWMALANIKNEERETIACESNK